MATTEDVSRDSPRDYAWDWRGPNQYNRKHNNKAIVLMELMKHQLDCAYRWLRSGEVEGLIFHCTPLCDMGLEAVVYSRRWIDEHGEEPVGCDELAPIHD